MTLPHWDDYWRSGRIVSCPTGSTDETTGALKNVWEVFFAALPDGARFLDVGTGNGALPLLALAAARARSARFEVHGVDLALIDPRRVVRDGTRVFENAVFYGGVRAEAMPFAAGYFDAVAGQYSLEYMRREAALREIRRVMADNVPACFVLHHASSIVVDNARESLSHARELEDGATAFVDLRDYVAAERSDATRAAALLARITERMQHLHRLAAISKGSQLLASVLPALGDLFESRHRLPAADFAAAYARTYKGFKAAEQRLSELVDAALDEIAMQHLADQARASGFHDVRFAPLRHEEGFLLGWRLDMNAAPL